MSLCVSCSGMDLGRQLLQVGLPGLDRVLSAVRRPEYSHAVLHSRGIGIWQALYSGEYER